MITAQNDGKNDHQNGAVEAPVAEGAVAAHKLAGRCLGIEQAVHTILVVRILLASVQHTLPVVVGDGVGDTSDYREDEHQRIEYGQPSFGCVLLHD